MEIIKFGNKCQYDYDNNFMIIVFKQICKVDTKYQEIGYFDLLADTEIWNLLNLNTIDEYMG